MATTIPRIGRFPCFIACLSVVFAAFLSFLMSPLAGRYPFLFFWPAVVITVWYGGLRSGVLAIFLAAIIPTFILHVDGIPAPPDILDFTSAVIFVLLSGLVSWIVDRSRQAERALRESVLFDREKAEGRTRVLQHITAELSRVLNQSELIEIIVQQAIRSLGAAAGNLVLLTEDKQELELVCYMGYSPDVMDQWQRFPVSLQGGALAAAVRSRNPVWIHSQAEFQEKFVKTSDVNLPRTSGFEGRAAVPLMVQGEPIGAIGLSFITPQPFNDEDRRFILTLAQQCEQALERIQLHENAKALAAEEERQRIARDLHDSVSQTLFAATVTAESLPQIWKRDPKRMEPLLDQLYTLNRAAAAEMRVLLWELRPEVLESTSLAILCSQLAFALKGRKDIQVSLDLRVENPDALPSPVHIAFYRIAQEALNNIVKHSQAKNVTIRLIALPNDVELQVIDDGIGFKVEEVTSGLGMHSMRERAERVSSEFSVSSSENAGTQVRVRWQKL